MTTTESTQRRTASEIPAVVWALRAASLVGAVALWEVFVKTGVLPVGAFSTPDKVWTWISDWVSSGDALPNILSTLGAALLGYLVGVVMGALVAAAFAFIPGVAPVLEPYMALLNSIPLIIVAPLFLLWLGTGILAKAALATLIVFFVAFFNLYRGFRSVDESLLNNARVLGASRTRLATAVYLPAVFSWLMSSLRIGIGFAFVGAVVGEFVGGNTGLGFQINLGQQLGEPEALIGAVFLLCVVAAGIDGVLARVESRFTHWRAF